MIKAVIFDLSGVIVTRFSDIGKRLEPLLNIGGKEIHLRFKDEEFQDFLKGGITEDEYWGKIIKKNNWKINASSLKKARRESFKEIEGTKKIMKNLKERGIKLGLLSSHTKEWVDFIREKFDYEKYFDSVLYSYQVGYVKPEEKFYKDIIKKLQAEPEYCIYIDDKDKYLEPAKELGMKTILFKSAKQLERDLTALSVCL